MKRFFSVLGKILPHLILILAVMMIVFFCIDLVNPAMAFLNNTITKYLFAIFSLLSAILAVCSIVGAEKKR